MDEIIIEQIRNLRGNLDKKIKIIKYLADHPEGVTTKQLRSNTLPTSNINTFYNYLKKLKKGKFIILHIKDKKRYYSLSKIGLANHFKKNFPDVRSYFNVINRWNSNIINSNLQEFIAEHEKTIDIEIILEKIEHIVTNSNLEIISNQTIRELIAEILYNEGLHEDSYNYENIAFPTYLINHFIEQQNPIGLHNNYIGQQFRKRYFFHKIPYNHLSYLKTNHNLHLHGLENLLSPLNILHDIRWIFLNGLETENHRSTPPLHLTSALSQIIGLLDFTNHDYVRTQGIHHFNYYLAPYLENKTENDIQKACESFFKSLYRLFIGRPRDFICSSMTLDFDNVPLHNYEVIKSGERLGHTYSNYYETANSINQYSLLEFTKGYDEINPYIFPKIILAISPENIKNFLNNDTIIEMLYKIIKEQGSNAIYLQNRSTDIAYLADLNRIRLPLEDELRSKGCIFATSLLNFETNENKLNLQNLIQQIDKVIDKLLLIGNWKKSQINEQIRTNKFQILGNSRNTPLLPSYFNAENPQVCLRLFSLKRLLKHHNISKKNGEIFQITKELLNHIYSKFEELNETSPIELCLSQTSSSSEAIIRSFGKYHLNLDKNALYESIREEDLDMKIEKERILNKYMTGGMVTRILINRRNYEEEDLKAHILKCFENDIELINFIDISHR